MQIHASGQICRTGSTTRQGRGELRTIMVEVAWSAVRFPPVWRARCDAFAPRKGPQKAIAILARRLLVVIWQALTHRALDRNADPAALERAWLKWATDHRLATSLGLGRAEFVRRALAQIGVPSPAR